MAADERQVQEYLELTKKMKSYEEALGVLYWDMRTGAPRKGLNTRSETIGVLSTDLFKLSTSERMGELLDALSAPSAFESLSPMLKRSVTESKKEYDRSKKIPADLYQKYVVLASQAESVWEECKPNNDFATFRPYLEQVVDYQKRFIELWGYEDNKYDTLLDAYEPGMTVRKLDAVFGALREKLVPLVAAVASKPPVDTSFMSRKVPMETQRAFSEFILKEIGYDFAAGRLDPTTHPFATGLNPGDVRVTTRYIEDDFQNSLFSTIHEGGHALYEQNISPDLIGTNLCTGTSMGIHESQSRLWENMIGRSRPFWERYYADFQRMTPELSDVPLDDFYRAVNEVKASLIRTEADELTYNLHIMIRYELEKQLMNDQLQVADLPAAWNAKYKEYLGIEPPNDELGVLQDVHWSGGGFGYFPSYALGNMYAAQMMDAMRKALPSFDALVAAGDFEPIKAWLTDKIYRHGRLLTPSEVIRSVAGAELDPTYLTTYLEAKYSEIYKM
ncbi:carboxypeptidase M32 [Paenibacillus antri]|uniref:Metal-dependent carboxypeptidase n=1 Tax=Paenibacillus antri TaxID=2582848 RepID=A0A5R9GML7_9BACL|nr:carboxypeptidase M32 [Paenibacillus antri]TLS53215.1 carboxypeptidase M32 [Paenibacillus antri]